MSRPSTVRQAACSSARTRKSDLLRHRPIAINSSPRVGVLCLILAAASLFFPASSAAGAELGSAAPLKARAREIAAAAEKEASSIRRGARQPRDEHDHDPRASASSVSRRRRHGKPAGEDGSGYAGGGGAGPRSSRRTSSSSQDKRETPSSFDVLDSEEDEEDEDGGSSWGGTDSTGSGSDGDGSEDSRGDDPDPDGSFSSSSCENYDTEEGLYGEETEDEDDEEGLKGSALGGDDDGNDLSEEEELSDSDEEEDGDNSSDRHGKGPDELSPPHRGQQQSPREQERTGRWERSGDGDHNNSVEVCVVTWNLAEESPPARDVEFLRHVSRESDLVAVGVQEIENLKPRRHEGGRTREWRRLLIRTLGRDFVRVGHHAMGAVQLTLFARREVLDRVKVIKLSEVVCGVGNVLQNKGGIGAYLRVDRTTFLFVAAHLAAHQGKLEERNAGYWRIATTLNQEIPPAWVTHASRKRAKRAKAAAAAAAAAAAREESSADRQQAPQSVLPWLPAVGRSLPPRGPFGDRVDRIFFFGDLNYRVDLSREDLEQGVSACRWEHAEEEVGGSGPRQEKEKKFRRRKGRRFRPGVTYPGTGALDALLDFDQLTLARSGGAAFGGFSEARVTFEPTYKYDKGSQRFDTSRKMRPPAWTDRILYSPSGPHATSPLEYTSVPDSCHSDHRPVYAKFRVRLAN